MTEVISVRFRSGCKKYDFAPNGVQAKMGDQVIVETAQGPEFATVTEGNHEVEPDGPGNVKSVDLLQEKVKVHLDSAAPNEAPRCYHNCEVCILRNGKGSRDGIEIPDRPARFVEESSRQGETERFVTPPFYLKDQRMEDAPTREKMGPASGSEGKSSRRRSSRRKSGSKPAGSGQGGERSRSRPPKRPQGQKKPQSPKGEGGKAEGGEAPEKRRRPHHRGGRHRNKPWSTSTAWEMRATTSPCWQWRRRDSPRRTVSPRCVPAVSRWSPTPGTVPWRRW